MEEDEYKSTYSKLASVPCVFEKALTNHHAKCSLAKHFCLADREGYSCENESSSVKCSEFLKILRKNSIFVLKLHDVDAPLPHNKEIRVQAGGITGVAKSIDSKIDFKIDFKIDSKSKKQANQPAVNDINGVLQKAIEKYGSLEKFPYGEIIQSVKQFQGRARRQR